MPTASRSVCGALPGGAPVEEIVLDSGSGISAALLSYGATLHRLHCPDRNGAIEDILVGFDDWQGHTRTRAFFGPVVGRFANRIAGARFTLDGRDYALDRNDGVNMLHGGHRGLDNRPWDVAEVSADGERARAVLRCVSPDGEGGFPGNLAVEAAFELDLAGTLSIDLTARSDAATLVNLTIHPLFNLAGARGGDTVLAHRLTMLADGYIPVDQARIPLGGIAPVEGTAFDFTTGERLGPLLESSAEPQIAAAGGIDHSFALRGGLTGEPRAAAVLEDPVSGRRLQIATNQPGLHLYTANDLDGTLQGKQGAPLVKWAGIAFEPQHFPDSPNRPDFPSCRLEPGKTWLCRTVFRFSVS